MELQTFYSHTRWGCWSDGFLIPTVDSCGALLVGFPLSRLILSSLAEYFFQRAGGVCRLWWHPVAWWGWGVLRPVLHGERPGGPTGAGGRALQHGRYTPHPGSPRSAWTSVLVPCVWVLAPSQWAPLHDGTTCRDAQGRGGAGGLWCM